MIGKVLGLDLGEKSLGIAESDLMGIIANGVENFRFESLDFKAALERVKFYCKRDSIKEIANYVTCSNNEHGVAKVIDKFILNR